MEDLIKYKYFYTPRYLSMLMLKESERELIQRTIIELQAILDRDSKPWTYIDLYPDLQ